MENLVNDANHFFFSSKDSGETRTMHNKSRSIEIMMGSEKKR